MSDKKTKGGYGSYLTGRIVSANTFKYGDCHAEVSINNIKNAMDDFYRYLCTRRTSAYNGYTLPFIDESIYKAKVYDALRSALHYVLDDMDTVRVDRRNANTSLANTYTMLQEVLNFVNPADTILTTSKYNILLNDISKHYYIDTNKIYIYQPSTFGLTKENAQTLYDSGVTINQKYSEKQTLINNKRAARDADKDALQANINKLTEEIISLENELYTCLGFNYERSNYKHLNYVSYDPLNKNGYTKIGDYTRNWYNIFGLDKDKSSLDDIIRNTELRDPTSTRDTITRTILTYLENKNKHRSITYNKSLVTPLVKSDYNKLIDALDILHTIKDALENNRDIAYIQEHDLWNDVHLTTLHDICTTLLPTLTNTGLTIICKTNSAPQTGGVTRSTTADDIAIKRANIELIINTLANHNNDITPITNVIDILEYALYNFVKSDDVAEKRTDATISDIIPASAVTKCFIYLYSRDRQDDADAFLRDAIYINIISINLQKSNDNRLISKHYFDFENT